MTYMESLDIIAVAQVRCICSHDLDYVTDSKEAGI